MLPKINTPEKNLEEYKRLIPELSDQLEETERLAKSLSGIKVNMVNATPKGGGVAELLRSLVPLMKGVGVNANWYTIPPKNDFFTVTKEIHNGLQGKPYNFPAEHKEKYKEHVKRIAELMKDMSADVWVMHDPQPLGVIEHLPDMHPSISRMHIDLSFPNREVWEFLLPYLKEYDRVIVSSKDFVKEDLREKTDIIQPAIDPLSSKNNSLDLEESENILRSYAISPDKPLMSQVARFDPWKDPLGVLESYRIAKKEIPDLQLVLMGLFLAADDPEAFGVFEEVKKAKGDDKDIHLFADPAKLGSIKTDTLVKAVQSCSEVIIQKSLREGFGLSITEAMWKRKAVIAGNAGGIKTQIQNGENGFLVSTPEETAERVVQIIKNKKMADEIGEKAHQTVKKNFLMPRLLQDYLKLFKKLC
jgi:trehalose synthase